MTFDYQIILLDGMPVNEATTENEDGSFTIFVNSNLDDCKQKEAALHALRHIENDDFARINEDIQEIELAAHNRKEGEL